MTARSSFPWSPLQTLIVWVLVACVAAGVWYAVFYAAAEDEWRAAGNELAAARSDLQARHARRDEVQRHAVQLDRDEAALAGAFTRIPGGDGRREDALLLAVPTLAEAAGLTIDRWHPLPDERRGPLVWAPVEVDARGGWAALHAFQDRVGALPQIVAVDLRAVEGTDDELTWHLVVRVARLTGEEDP